MKRPAADFVLAFLATAAFGAMLLGNLGHPLFWSDEADTAMFGTRVLEFGYPKVHGPDNVVYQFGPDIALGVKESFDAYIGTTWGHFYFSVPGLWWAQSVADPWEKTASPPARPAPRAAAPPGRSQLSSRCSRSGGGSRPSPSCEGGWPS